MPSQRYTFNLSPCSRSSRAHFHALHQVGPGEVPHVRGLAVVVAQHAQEVVAVAGSGWSRGWSDFRLDRAPVNFSRHTSISRRYDAAKVILSDPCRKSITGYMSGEAATEPQNTTAGTGSTSGRTRRKGARCALRSAVARNSEAHDARLHKHLNGWVCVPCVHGEHVEGRRKAYPCLTPLEQSALAVPLIDGPKLFKKTRCDRQVGGLAPARVMVVRRYLAAACSANHEQTVPCAV